MATVELSVASGAATDVGRVRQLNEDSFVAATPVFLVADGMGGHEAGEIASAEAVATLRSLIGRPAVTPQDVYALVTEARERVVAIETSPGRDAGTTLSGVVLTVQDGTPYWLVLNVGDSRTYRLAAGELEQISVDHSEIQELLDTGGITPEQVAGHPMRHVVTRALGAGGYSDADFWLIPVGPQDRVLICSDGLTGELTDEEIAQVLLAEPHPQAAAERLVRAAVLKGGHDNVTAVVVDGQHDGTDGSTIPRAGGDDEPDEDTKPRSGVPTARRR